MKSEKMFSVDGKIIIVTGAGGNLGLEYTTYLLEQGATVYAWDKDGEKLKQCKVSENLIPKVVDLTNESEVQAAIQDVVHAHGQLDGLINNAALNPAVGVDDSTNLFAPYEDYDIEMFRKEVDANLTSMMIVMKHAAPSMISQKRGAIVNVASEVSVAAHDHRVYDQPGKYKSPAYTASKTAVIGLTRQWAARLGSDNVRVNAVSIGGVRFPTVPEDFAKRFGNMNMLGRMAEPHEYNATMQYLLSDASSFMTGANIIIDGGKTAW